MSYDEEPKVESDKELEEQSEEKFPFLQETIKSEVTAKKKIFIQIARVGMYGLVFGGLACLGFFALKPWAESNFKGNPETVSIPKDENPKAKEEEPSASDQGEPPILDVGSLQAAMKNVYAVASEAQKCVATIRSVSGDDVLEAEDESAGHVSAIILVDNGQELLLLGDSSVCEEAEQWQVKFADNSVYDAALKKQDKNSGLAVFSVSRGNITDSTWSAIKVGALGNSHDVLKGDLTITAGNAFGYSGSVGYGIIGSMDKKEVRPDKQLTVLATDIPAEVNGTGALFNIKGEVIGMITPEIWNRKQPNTVKALGISDLKPMIELLLNGQSVPYVGVYGETIKETLPAVQGLPIGVYVVEVHADSPAMAAGVQSGDIIQQISDVPVSNVLSYENVVSEKKIGESVEIKGKRRGVNGYVDIDFSVVIKSRE